MKAIFTRFPGLYATKGNRVETTWGALFSRPLVVSDKRHLPGWSPALYQNNSRAEGSEAISLSALVVEYDHGTTIKDAAELWDRFYAWVYTTHSHRVDAPRFRVVIPLTRSITPGEHALLWRWADRFTRRYGQEIDPKAKDAKRFWFCAGHALGAPFEAIELGGELMDPQQFIDEQLHYERATRESAPPPSRAPLPPTITGDVISRARSYIGRIPGAVSGHGGHAVTFTVARILVTGFALDTTAALRLLTEWNRTCDPPWSEKELAHKISQANSTPSTKPMGWLLGRRAA